MKATAFAIISVLIFTGSAFGAEWFVPPSKKDCSTCHVLDEEGTRVRLKIPLSALCLECHPDRKSPAEHEVDIRPNMRVSHLPLSGGKMTCVTCHEPHGLTKEIKLLRASPTKICTYCHKM